MKKFMLAMLILGSFDLAYTEAQPEHPVSDQLSTSQKEKILFAMCRNKRVMFAGQLLAEYQNGNFSGTKGLSSQEGLQVVLKAWQEAGCSESDFRYLAELRNGLQKLAQDEYAIEQNSVEEDLRKDSATEQARDAFLKERFLPVCQAAKRFFEDLRK